MLGLSDYLVWVISFGAEVYVLALAVKNRDLRRYFSLNLYVLATALVTLGQYYEIHAHGFDSIRYRFYYYYSDSLLSILMYVAIIGFYQHVFRGAGAATYIRILATAILAGVAAISFIAIWRSESKLTSPFVMELARNLYFVGVALTYLLWIAMIRLRDVRLRVVQLVLSLGVFFSASAVIYCMRYFLQENAMLHGLFVMAPPVLGCWLPLSWAYTFTRVPEDARLASHDLAALHR
jgi:hypothetical protein